MLPSVDDLDAQVRLAEQEVIRSDQHVRGTAAALKRRWMSRMPAIAALAVSGLIVSIVLPSRRGPDRIRRSRSIFGWQRLLLPLSNLGIARGVAVMSALIAGFTARKKAAPPVTVHHVDLDRYCGLWYEVARLPLREERVCDSDVTAHYAISGGVLRIVNRCRRADGRIKTALGRARIVDRRTQARLQVSFAPAFMDFLPFVWGDYWVLDLVDDYSAAMVGTPDRRHLWLLARTPTLPGAQLHAFLAHAEQQGYDVSKLDYTRHTVRHAEVAPQHAADSPPVSAEPAVRTAITVD